jgi:DUF917 family protein
MDKHITFQNTTIFGSKMGGVGVISGFILPFIVGLVPIDEQGGGKAYLEMAMHQNQGIYLCQTE